MSSMIAAIDFGYGEDDLQTADVQHWRHSRPTSLSLTTGYIDQALVQNSLSYQIPQNHRRYTRVASLLEGQSHLSRRSQYRAAADRVLRMLRAIYSSSSVLPTPQPSVTLDGTIEISWLVEGTMVTLTVGADSGGFIAARGPLESIISDQEFHVGWEPLSETLLSKLTQLLLEMGKRVAHPLEV